MQKTLLVVALLGAAAFNLSAQNNDLLVEKLKFQVKSAQYDEGRDKALGLALMGVRYLDSNNPGLQRLLYETYYAPSDGYYDEPGETEVTFSAADFAPSGREIAVAVSDGTIRYYENKAPYTYTTWSLPEGMPLDVAYSPDGKSLAVGTSEGGVLVVNRATGSVTASWDNVDYIRSIAWSPRGDKLAAGGDENIVFVYDVASKSQIHAFEAHTDWIRGVSWSADGMMLAAASDDHSATVWSLSRGGLVVTHNDHEDYCRDVAFAPIGEALVTVSDDMHAFIYDPATNLSPKQDLGGHEAWIMTTDWSDDGKMIATADNAGVFLVHTLRTSKTDTYNSVMVEEGWVDIDFSPDSKQVAAMSMYNLSIYQLGTPTPLITLNSLGEAKTEALAADGSQLEATLAQVLPTASQLYPSPDGKKLAFINGDYQGQVLDMQTGTTLFIINQHEDWIRDIAWSSDGNMLATASDDKMVGIWSAADGSMVQFLSGHTDWVRNVDFAPDNKTLVSVGDDGVIRSWDIKTGRELNVTESVESYLLWVGFSPSQAFLAAQNGDGYLYVWNARTNEMVFNSEDYTVVGTVKWTSGNALLVQGANGELFSWSDADGWSTKEGEVAVSASGRDGRKAEAYGSYIALSGAAGKKVLTGHRQNISSLEWSPDGNFLVSQSVDGRLGLWNAAQGAMIGQLPISSDGGPRRLIWAKDGKGFFAPGIASKILVSPASVVEESKDTPLYLTAADFTNYELETIFLNREDIRQSILRSGDVDLLNTIAAFYEDRAAIHPDANLAASDRKMASAFRAAAESSN